MLTAKTFFYADKMALKHSYVIYDCHEYVELITNWLSTNRISYEVFSDSEVEFFSNSGHEADEILNRIRGVLQNVTILAI